MLAWREYSDSLCLGCSQPKATAWHPDNDGWLEVTGRTTCHGCTAIEREAHDGSDGPVRPVEYLTVTDVRDYAKKPLPPIKPVTPNRRRRR